MWPGRTHDSRVFRNSSLCTKFESGQYQGIILADSGYPSKHYMLTPKLHERDVHDQAYNVNHKRCRSAVERAIGHLKRRFHCLHAEMRLAPEKVCKVTVACAMLHNLAKEWNTPLPLDPDDTIPEEIEEVPNQQDNRRNDAVRDLIISRYF